MDGSMIDDEPIEGLARSKPDDTQEGLKSKSKPEDFLRNVKAWWKRDAEHSSEWRTDAKEDYDFVAGRQISDEDKEKLREEMRPYVTFNRVSPITDAVSGLEVQNRHETRFIPRTQGDVQVNELLTSAAKFFTDECDAEDEDSDAFLDTVICGMGWSEARIDFDEDPEGMYVREKTDPLEMWWDCNARRRNLKDAKRFWRVKDYPVSEAKDLFPGKEAWQLHAAWATEASEDEEDIHNADKRLSYLQERDVLADPGDTVRIVHLCWAEKKPFYKIAVQANPMLGVQPQAIEVEADEYKKAVKRFDALGVRYQAVKLQKLCWYQVRIGADVLEEREKTPDPHAPLWRCITGKRDRNKGTFYGLVRNMKDPQRWANKWLSQSLHILNLQAKGGLIAERGAFEDDNQAERSWANPSEFTWAMPGTLSGQNPRFMPKVAPAMPQGPEKYLELAISSIRDASGVNLELLGQADRQQPGVLEQHRKQSGMTILAHLFDSLRSYRKQVGRTLLYMMNEYLSDGRLVRIVGEEMERYVPMLRQMDDATKFDVIVDESPTSTNNKEQIWAMLLQMMPMLGESMPPQVWLKMLKYSPIPASVLEEMTGTMEEAQQQAAQQPDPEMQKLQAEMQAKQMDAQTKQQSAQADMAIKQQTAQNELQIAREEMQMEREKSAAEIRAMFMELNAKMAAMQQESALKAQIKREEAQVNTQIRQDDAERNRELREVETASRIEQQKKMAAARPKPAQGANR